MGSIEPVWVTDAQVEQLNQLAVADSGEVFFVRDRALLESAVARPKNRWSYAGEEDVVALGVSLCIGIAQNHPFEQGNKRAGFESFRLFLHLNGYALKAHDTLSIAMAIIESVEGKMTEWDLTEFLRVFVGPR